MLAGRMCLEGLHASLPLSSEGSAVKRLPLSTSYDGCSAKETVLAALDEYGDAMTPKELAEATGMPHGTARMVMRQLSKQGTICRVKRGHYSL
jgi:predicted Rossmann fold nucleotide-binding protein DprA/Smf involved in DNA uptake